MHHMLTPTFLLCPILIQKVPQSQNLCSPDKGYIFTIVNSPTEKMSGDYTVVFI